MVLYHFIYKNLKIVYFHSAIKTFIMLLSHIYYKSNLFYSVYLFDSVMYCFCWLFLMITSFLSILCMFCLFNLTVCSYCFLELHLVKLFELVRKICSSRERIFTGVCLLLWSATRMGIFYTKTSD